MASPCAIAPGACAPTLGRRVPATRTRPLQLHMDFTRCRSGSVTRSMCSPDIYSVMGSSPMSCPDGVG